MKQRDSRRVGARVRTHLSSSPVRTFVLTVLLPSFAWWSGPLQANPHGGVVVHGQVDMRGLGGRVLNIRQNSSSAIIDWEGFSIEAGETTRFIQPGSNAAILNRVTGGDLSEIHGALRANGNVFLINPNGILVGPGGSIDVHGLVLSTLDIDNGEFLAGGDQVFKGASKAGVTNLGRINAIGGDVFLIGHTVTNSGTIHASEGTVGLAAGEEVLIKAEDGFGGERVYVRATGTGVSGTGILNDGTISGAAAELKASGNHYALAINNKGAIRATGAVNSGGRVMLQGIGGSVANSGSIRATSSTVGRGASVLIAAAYAKVDGEMRAEAFAADASVKIAATEAAEVGATIKTVSKDGIGGSVAIESPQITLTSTSLIDVSGTNGGEVRIGGGFQGGDPDFANASLVEMEAGAAIHADAIGSGDGGSVVLWSDGDTLFGGEITALGRGTGSGGLVEVSGKEGLVIDGTVSTLAESGAHGLLLLDPKNITISTASSSATNINNSTLASLVVGNHVVISTLDAGTAQAGHISVSAPVRYSSGNSLTLLAEGDLYVGDDLINSSTGDVNLVAGWNPEVMPLATLLGSFSATPHATLPGTSTATGVVDMDATIFTTPGAFGNAGGSVYVGSSGAPNVAADRAVVVGSRQGQTNVAGYDVNVWGSAYTGGINAGAQRYTQIGYNRRDAGTANTLPATGRIRVGAVNDVSVIANKYNVGIQGSSGWNSTTDNTGNASFAQIGHGGERDSARDMEMSGTIIVEAGGDLSLLGGKAYNNHASIGHGAYDNRDTDLTRLASIGEGEIRVEVGGDVKLIAGLGYHAHVQIGHGGGNLILSDFAESSITVNAGGNVLVQGGAGFAGAENNTRAQAQIGHGGYDADLIVGGATSTPGSGKGYKGDITVSADGTVQVLSGNNDANNLAVIGNGGIAADGDHSGNISVTAGAGVELTAGNGTGPLFAQIGHIAYDTAGSISGTVSVTADDGGVRLRGGNSTANYAIIGSGGYLIKNGTTVGGNTLVNSKGTDATDGISLRSGDGSYASAQIGHLSILGAAGPVINLTGDVDVKVAGGGLFMEASALGYFSHVMIGHGGRDQSGTKSGSIWVDVADGDISVLAGGFNASSRYNHAQIGHGGYGNGITISDSVGSGEIAGILQGIHVSADNGSMLIRGGQNAYSYAMVGNGGTRAGVAGTYDLTGDISLHASGDITASGGTASYAYAQVGHGGASAVSNTVWNLGGEIEVAAGGTVAAAGGSGSTTYAQIGHGGLAVTTTSSIAASPITVTAATGDVLLLGGTVSSTGAKIGHGNHNQKLATFGESPVTVSAGRNVQLISPQFDTYTAVSNAGTQIGHGGFGATVGTLPSALGYSGDISVTAGGKLDVIAGRNATSYNWSLIGHTSYYNSTGIHSGDITVMTGTQAGLSDYGLTIHGAYGDYLPLAGGNAAAGGYYSFAAIGHRGHSNATGTYYTGLHGDILVDVMRGGIAVLGGDGVVGTTLADTPPDIRLHGAQIGHGGYSAGHPTDGISGNIQVYAEGDILLKSGNSRNAPVMIGHGGYSSFGPIGLAGEVLEVVSRNGSLELDSTLAIDTTRGGVMIGHGAPTPASGTRMGDVLVDIGGEISVLGNLSFIGHRTSTSGGISDADLTIRARSFDRLTGDSGSQLFLIDSGLGAQLAANLAAGDVSIVGLGTMGIESDATMVWNTGFDLNLLSYSDLFVVDDLINRGGGSVNLFAGWDPSVASLGFATIAPDRGYWIRDVDADGDLFDVDGSYGNGDGSVWVGAHANLSAADRSVVVASRTGETNVAGYDVMVWGAAFTGGINDGQQRYSQIGYNRRDAGSPITDAASGRIRVGAVRDIEVAANHYQVGFQGSNGWTSSTDNTGNASFAQIGHGGERDSVRDMQLSGAIIVEAGNDLSLLGGKAYNNHATIGHGGYDNPDDDGTNLATLGGDITVAVGGDLSLEAGLGYHAHVQIGHGGGNHYLASFTESDILVTAGGNVSVIGGMGISGNENNSRAQAQIGHGGYNADFIADSTPGVVDNVIPVSAGSGQGYRGDITVDAGGYVMVQGGFNDANNLALIGNGGLYADGDHGGLVNVTAGIGIDLKAGTGADSLIAQIGHVSFNSANAITGDVIVTAEDGGIRVTGGGSTANYATIGSGGYGIVDGSSIGGATTVRSLGTDTIDGILLRSGAGSHSSAHIGHLSLQNVGGSVHPVANLSGVVEVSVAGGGLSMEAVEGAYSHAMIGHGGHDSSGDKLGKITVTVSAGDLLMSGSVVNAGDRYNHVQIGHGGYGNGVFGTYSGDIDVEATTGSVALLAGQGGYSYARIGHGGSGGGDSSVLTLGGAVEVTADGDITLAGGGRSHSDAQIGHGGRLYSIDTPVGRTSITASPIEVNAGGDVLVLSGRASYTPAKIGHGGTQLKLSSFAESSIDVTAGRNIRLVSPQFDTFTSVSYSNTSIGHGGVYASVGEGLSGYSGDVTVEAGGKIDVLASKNSGTYNWSLIGHTSYYYTNSRGVHSGDISVTSGTVAGLGDYGLTVQAASGDFSSVPALAATGSYYSFAAIGHHGHSGNTALSGDILVDVVRGGVIVQGGNGITGTTAADTPPDIRLHDAQIGHGGYNVSGTGLIGSVRVYAESDIVLRAGSARHSPVLIGHGGYLSSGAMGLAGDAIEVVSREGSLELDSTAAPTGGSDGTAVYIGNGSSTLTSGLRQGDILVDVAGEISFVGTLPSWIGHRSSTTNGIANADVTIRARSTDFAAGDSGGELFRFGSFFGSVLAPHLNAGHLSLVATGSDGLEVDTRIVGNSAFDLNLLSHSNIFILDDLLNQGSGDVNVIAGWNPEVAPLYPTGEILPTAASSPTFREYWIRDVSADADLFAIPGAIGNSGSSVWIGAGSTLAGADRSVAVGSRTGQTNVAGYDVNVWGSALTGGVDSGAGKYSQIGYNRADSGTAAGSAATGRIRVSATNDLVLEANHYGVGASGSGSAFSGVDQTGFASFAKIGHGGERDMVAGSSLSGAIVVEAGNRLASKAGDTLESYVQIGHGGHAAGAGGIFASGDIGVSIGGSIDLSGGEGVRSSVQIGHGGDFLTGSRAGSVVVSAGGTIDLLAGSGEDSGVRIGHGGAGAGGVSSGAIAVHSQDQLLLSAGGGTHALAQVGHGGRQGSGTYSGAIGVQAMGMELVGGSGAQALAQIGHGGFLSTGLSDGQAVDLVSGGDLLLRGGEGTQAGARIGHGGYGSTGLFLRGDIEVVADGAIDILGGNGAFAQAQIGNLGVSPNTRLGGGILVSSGANIHMEAVDGNTFAYAKIGHGQDLPAGLATFVNLAEVGGDIRVGAATSLSMIRAMIGHLNGGSTSQNYQGSTQLAVGMGDPADPASGSITADGESEFAGAEGLRFYLPQRANNGIAPGATLNGQAFSGAAPDPFDHQRDDEFVIHILGDQALSPNEHGNLFDTGPVPSNASGFAFYYDTITVVAGAGLTPSDTTSGDENGGGADPAGSEEPESPFGDMMSFYTLENFLEDWLRDREEEFSRSGEYRILYENFWQYSPSGDYIRSLLTP
ncbi:MAG: filamentous hemagglutinin N-terminal domain-containing protein [Verrucomicrobiae bacterium]|nr:filamentous hemagglutinin N-terminal domain-containing protein [Verrucomicrobiae bacterium]